MPLRSLMRSLMRPLIRPLMRCGSLAPVLLGLLVACQDLTVKLPAGVADPASYRTDAVARKIANGTRYNFVSETWQFARWSGGFTDELRWVNLGAPTGSWDGGQLVQIDSRFVSETGGAVGNEFESVTPLSEVANVANYAGLQRVRAMAFQARHALVRYASPVPGALVGEMFAYEAYAVLMLADLFCAGVPLTVVGFEDDITYKPGSTTDELYRQAAALFDSALVWSAGEASVTSLAQVGKGRALLALQQYAAAAQAVQAVPPGFRFSKVWGFLQSQATNGWSSSFGFFGDREGQNGLPFASTTDPRITRFRQSVNVNPHGLTNVRADTNWTRTIVIASAIEARLIEAEAALQAGSATWLELLNTLRTNGQFTLGGTGGTDTLWQAGTGGVMGLAPLADPGLGTLPPGKSAFDVRLDLIVQERAYWLFLTGTRQGDLRRLVRNYGRSIQATYPTGDYGGGTGAYHDFIDLPVGKDEHFNPHFRGCLWRDA